MLRCCYATLRATLRLRVYNGMAHNNVTQGVLTHTRHTHTMAHTHTHTSITTAAIYESLRLMSLLRYAIPQRDMRRYVTMPHWRCCYIERAADTALRRREAP